MSAQPKQFEANKDWPEAIPPATTTAPERTGEISAALAKAQCDMHNPGFDSSNPHFKNRFASLAAVRNAVVPVLAKYGIAMSQDLTTGEGIVSCTTILWHGSGQKMVFGPLTLPVSKNDAQGFGSACTYARRYSLMSVAGVVGDDDDDANAASGKPPQYTGNQDPRGDMGKNVPVDKAMKGADMMRSILEQDLEEGTLMLRILDHHDMLNKDPDFYVAASDQLSTKEKTAWRKYVTMAKSAQKADAATQPGRRF